MKNVQTRKLMTAILVALMLLVIGCCGILAANTVDVSENTAVAAEIPVTTKIELTNNLPDGRVFKGQSFKLIVTVSSLLGNKASINWTMVDIIVGPLTADGKAFDMETASKLRVKPYNGNEDEIYNKSVSNLHFGDAGYSDASSDQLQRTADDPTANARGGIRISVNSSDTDGNRQTPASKPLRFEIEIEVALDLEADFLSFGCLKTMPNSVVYGENLRQKHTLGQTPQTVGFISADTDTVMFISENGLNKGDTTKLTSFDIVDGSKKLLATEREDNVYKFVVSESTKDLVLIPFFSAGTNAVVGVSDGSENFVPNVQITSNALFEIENLSHKFDRVVLQTTDVNGEVATYYVEIWKNGAYLSDLTVKDNELTTAFHPHTNDYEINLPAASETTLSLTATVFEGMSVNDTIAIESKSGCATVKTTASGEAFTVKVGETGGSIVLTVSSADGTATNDYTVKFNVAKKVVEGKPANNAALYAIIGVLAGLVVAGLVIFLIIILKKKKKKEEETTQA